MFNTQIGSPITSTTTAIVAPVAFTGLATLFAYKIVNDMSTAQAINHDESSYFDNIKSTIEYAAFDAAMTVTFAAIDVLATYNSICFLSHGAESYTPHHE